MMDNATKRAPHCFNFLRQFRILSKSGAGNFDQQSKVPGLCPNALHYYFVFFRSSYDITYDDDNGGDHDTILLNKYMYFHK